jgi:alcohol dehydrogenase class IV
MIPIGVWIRQSERAILDNPLADITLSLRYVSALTGLLSADLSFAHASFAGRLRRTGQLNQVITCARAMRYLCFCSSSATHSAQFCSTFLSTRALQQGVCATLHSSVRSPSFARRPRPTPPVAVFEPVWDEASNIPFVTDEEPDPADRVSVTQLTVSFRDDVTECDAKALLAEYARLTCAENGVLRCDVLRSAPSRSRIDKSAAKYFIWVVFADAMGRAEHERSAHASKLRLLLAPKPEFSDNALELAKLASSANFYRTFWPRSLNSWRAASDYSPPPPPTSASTSTFTPMSSAFTLAADNLSRNDNLQDHIAPLRHALDILVKNVGLEDAVVLVATATVAEDDYVKDAKDVCARYADDLIAAHADGRASQLRSSPNSFAATSNISNGVVRAAVLSHAGVERQITILQVHDKEHPDGALFDTGLAADLLEPNGWRVNRFLSMFPDLAGWRIVDMDDMPWNTPGREHELESLLTDKGQPAMFMPIGEVYERQEEMRAAADAAKGNAASEDVDSSAMTVESEAAPHNASFGDVVDIPGVAIDDNGSPVSPLTSCGVSSESVDLSSPTLSMRQCLKDAIDVTAMHHSGDVLMEPIQQIRVLHGSGAFQQIEAKLRRLCDASIDSPLSVFAVSGWNEARLQPLVMELDAGMDASRVALNIGVGVFGASATLAKVAAGVTSARRHQSDVVVGFGGGAVLDISKAVAALSKLSASDVSAVLSKIRDAAEAGRMTCEICLECPALPLMLVPSTVGSCVEVSDRALLNATLKDGSVRRISVCFTNSATPRQMAVVDPRLVIPRRMNSQDAAMGGLQALCFAIDVLLCPAAPKQARDLAERAIVRGRDAIMRARREPVSSDGPARDVIVDAAMFSALAREACGGLGVATCLSIAMLDGAEPTPCGLDGPLRIIIPRVSAAIASELHEISPGPCLAAQIVVGREDASSADLSRWILNLAEDIGVMLVGDIGVHASDVERVVQAVRHGGLLTECADSRLVSPTALTSIVLRTNAQTFEL